MYSDSTSNKIIGKSQRKKIQLFMCLPRGCFCILLESRKVDKGIFHAKKNQKIDEVTEGNKYTHFGL